MLRTMVEYYIWMLFAFPPVYIKFLLEVTQLRIASLLLVFAMVEIEKVIIEIEDPVHLP